MLEDLRENLRESLFVILRYLGYADWVKIDLVFLVKRATLHTTFQHGSSGRCRGNLQDIQICRLTERVRTLC
jgi:hypothetical protein